MDEVNGCGEYGVKVCGTRCGKYGEQRWEIKQIFLENMVFELNHLSLN